MNADELKNLISKIKKDKKTMFIIGIALVGMLLILLSGTGQESGTDPKIKYEEQGKITENELALEVESFLENIKGAGKTKVILTFETYEETVYAYDKDEKHTSDGTKDYSDEYVIIDSGDAEAGLKLKILSPKIRGVAVICEGGDNPIIKEQITSALSALFDISSNNISVAVMAD